MESGYGLQVIGMTTAPNAKDLQSLPTVVDVRTTELLRTAAIQAGAGRQRIIYIALLVVLFSAMVAGSWARWPDIDVDCGREAYVPARIIGALPGGHALLYRDVQFQFGPLTPYWHAFLFWMFGVHLNVLYLAGMGVAFAIVLLTFVITEMLTSSIQGWLIASLFMTACVFRPSLMNYVFPYTLAANYGVLLLAVVVWLALRRIQAEGSQFELWLIGIATGLALLNKHEFAAATVACVALMLCFAQVRRGLNVRSVVALSPALVLPAIVYGYFLMRLGWNQLVGENLWPTYLIHAQTAFYASQTGLPRWRNLYLWRWRLEQWWVPALIVMVVATHVARFLARKSAKRISAAIVALMVLAWPVWGMLQESNRNVLAWAIVDYYGWIVPLVVLAWLMVIRIRRDWTKQEQGALFITLVGIVPLLRTLRNPALQYYGNLLVWPSIIVYLWLICFVIPLALAGSDDRYRRVLERCTWVLVGTITLFYAHSDLKHFQYANFTVHGAAGEIRAGFERGSVFQQAADVLRRDNNRFVLVVPEDAFLYVFTSTSSPLVYTHLVPGHVSDPAHEQSAIRVLDAHPPDHIVIVERELSDYFAVNFKRHYFGQDYNRDLYKWITAHYHLDQHIAAGGHWADIYTPATQPGGTAPSAIVTKR